jgi:CheY-like chemotaxis protein
LELDPVITRIAKTLPRLIGEDIEFSFTAGHGPGRVRVDPVQIEQILMNLAANARDAMPRGGRLRIVTSQVTLNRDYIQRKSAIVPEGDYALVTVSDDGEGIPSEHMPHIFEPFYTTKPLGKGTGLGLATVYGIVKQNRGFIWAYSESGMGTVFKVYLPCVAARAVAEELPLKREVAARGSEVILLVEDEQPVREATAEFLTLQGYTVLQAKDGLDALAIAKAHSAPIQLVVTDVVMPNMSGGQMAKELAVLRPETKLLFVSGYAGKTVLDHEVIDVESNFMEKPYSLKELSRKIRGLLNLPAGGAPTLVRSDSRV